MEGSGFSHELPCFLFLFLCSQEKLSSLPLEPLSVLLKNTLAFASPLGAEPPVHPAVPREARRAHTLGFTSGF